LPVLERGCTATTVIPATLGEVEGIWEGCMSVGVGDVSVVLFDEHRTTGAWGGAPPTSRCRDPLT
jgi:hypothetical protein